VGARDGDAAGPGLSDLREHEDERGREAVSVHGKERRRLMARWKKITSNARKSKRGNQLPGRVRYRKRVRCPITGRKLSRVVRR